MLKHTVQMYFLIIILLIISNVSTKCKAQNHQGTSISSTGVSSIFKITPLKENVTVGDLFELNCSVSKEFLSTNNIRWAVQHSSIRFKSYKYETDLAYQSVLSINPVKKLDEGNYLCTAITKYNQSIQKNYKLNVHKLIKPNFTYTNLNKSETLYEADDVKEIVLQCYVIGWPEPEITWWKNNDQINTTGNDSCQYKFTNNNQELHIVSLFSTCNGKYLCKAKNHLNYCETYQEIIITNEIKYSRIKIIIVVSLLMIKAIILIYIFLKLRRERKIRKKLKEGFLMFFKESALLHPELRINDRSDLLQYDEKWEFSRDKLKLGKRLGTGEFGIVMKANARGICGDDKSKTKVAVKVVKKSIEMTNIQALANELNILMYLGKHVNVVDLLGACTKNIAKRELDVIFEYCHFGNLRDYLIKRRHKFINQIDPSTGKFNISSSYEILKQLANFQDINNFNLLSEQNMSADNIALISNVKQSFCLSKYISDYKKNLKTIRTENLLVWAFQVAQGMKYLSQRNILHGDLAARNILLAKNNVVKISSFGLSKNMGNHDFYVKKDDAPLPIKWLAIDSLKDEIYTTQSDVWSFGIMLWEFFSLGKTPYPGMELKECVLKVQEGYRMEKPEFATDEIYNIMFKCWLENPSLRPTFTELADSIGDFLDEQVQRHFIDLNSPYVDTNRKLYDDTKHDNLMIKSSQDQVALAALKRSYVIKPKIDFDKDTSYIFENSTYKNGDSDVIFSKKTNELSTATKSSKINQYV